MISSLQQNNTRHLFYRLLAVMAGCSIFFYFLIRLHETHMQKKQLELSQSNYWNAFTLHPGSLPFFVQGEYQLADSGSVPAAWLKIPRDTLLYLSDRDEWHPFKILTCPYHSNNRNYELTTYVSSREMNHLIIKVLTTEALILIVLFISVIYINRKTSSGLWLPFRFTMKKLNEYDINGRQSFSLPEHTGIIEFDELNAAVSDLIAKITQAYNNQKQFVENASHEIQTPLAIIRSKLELLIDQPGITPEVAGLLMEITEANERLSRMNRNLLLLAKIENGQFPSKSPIDISALLEQTIITYQQHYEDRFPELLTSIQKNIAVTANTALIEILFGNLIRNAVIHNSPNGNMRIELNRRFFKIMNTGPAPEMQTDQLFERFKKGTERNTSTGLGLALVKQICQLYHFKIDYSYSDGTHCVTVKLQP